MALYTDKIGRSFICVPEYPSGLEVSIYGLSFKVCTIDHIPRTATERFLYGVDGKKTNYIIYEKEQDGGMSPICLSKESFYAVQDAYFKRSG